jgi:hypothetical protein
MAKADGWPLSTAETILGATLAYLVLLIGLAVARPGPVRAAVTAPFRVAALLDTPRPVAAVRREGLAAVSCVSGHTAPQSYAGQPGVQRLAFGPPVEPTGPLTVAEINGELWHRLCGGIGTPGGRSHGPDRRLYVAIDAAVNGRDPNRAVSRSAWAAGVDRFIAHDALWDRARVVTLTARSGTTTFGMRVRPGGDPLVLRTNLAEPATGRYLALPVRSAGGPIVTVILRLPCGFQPVFVGR